MAVYFKQNDTFRLSLTLLGANGSPQDLTGATAVVFSMRDADTGDMIVNRALCTVLSPAEGSCLFTGDASATENFGTFQYEIEVTFNDGGIVTFPTEGYEEIVIVKQIA